MTTMQEFVTLFTSSAKGGKLPSFAWRPATALNALNLGKLNPIPHKYRQATAARRQRSRSNKEWARPRAAVDDLTSLKRSFNPFDTVRAVRRHRWSLTDLQYVGVFGLLVFSLCLPGPPAWFKACFSLGMTALLLMPITRQFFFPALPIITWLVYFFSSR